jgi:Spy/CpxP family protein refolding chaperone
MNLRRLLVLTGIAALAAAPAVAQGPAPGAGPDPSDPMVRVRHVERYRMGRDMMMRDLNLTKDQSDKIADLRDKQQRRAIDLRAQIQTAQLDLRKLMRADKPDKAAIGKQVDRLSGLRADLQKSRIGTMLDVREILTPEQREKMRGRMGMMDEDDAPPAPGMGDED